MTEPQEPSTLAAKNERKRHLKIILLTISFLVILLIGYSFGRNSVSFNDSTTAEANLTTETTDIPSTTESTTGFSPYTEDLPTNSNDPYDAYFHVIPCRTSEPYSFSNFRIKYTQSDTDIAELRRRAKEIAGDDYYKQSKLFDKAFEQYAAKKSIEVIEFIPNQEASPGSLRDEWQFSGYPTDPNTLQDIITESQQKCPNDYAGQLNEIGLQVEAYSKVKQ